MRLLICLLCCIILELQTADGRCPCSNPSLCSTITNTTRSEIFVFSLQNKASSWVKFDWKKLTTVVSVGYVSTELMCLAHQHNARVVTIANYKLSELTNATLRTQWVNNQLSVVRDNYYDGINIDFEEPILKNQKEIRDAYTALVKETSQAFKQSNPHYQVTVDVAWSPDCIDLRCYDNRGLAENTDFLFVMAYDEQSQIFGDKCVGLANSDFYKTLQGLHGYLNLGIKPEQLVLGVPWYGYDYPCLSLSQKQIEKRSKKGRMKTARQKGRKHTWTSQFDHSKDNVCSIKRVPFRGVNCSDAAGRQIDYRVIYPMLVNHSSGGRHWDEKARSPFFNYKDATTGQMHQVRYDDPESLGLKYSAAETLGLRGVGTWNIDCLDFSSAPYAEEQTKKMFDAFPNYPKYLS